MITRTVFHSSSLFLVAILIACGSSSVPRATPPTSPAPVQGATSTAVEPAQPAARPPEVTTVEGISEYVLGNGLRLLLFPDQSKDTVTVNVTYFVGSRHEGYGEAGMAHLLEHMLFKGTPEHPNIWKALQDRGAGFNGTTWVDRTNYFETLPAGGDNLEFALALEADRMVNSELADEALAKEFSVVRNEFEMGENDPEGVLLERMHSVAFVWHNYGNSTIGNKSDIERVPIDRLRRFYRRYYRPDNAMVVVAGRFAKKEALALADKHFGAIPRPEEPLTSTYTREPVQDGERVVMLRRHGEVPLVGLLYHSVPGAHADYAAAEAIVHLLTTEPTGRLYKALVESGLAARVWGKVYGWAEPGTMIFVAEVGADKSPERVRDKMISVVEGLGTSTIEPREVDRFIAREAKNFTLAMTDSRRIGIQLSEWAALGDWRMMFVHRDRGERVTPADVKRVAAAYLLPSNRTLGMFAPTPSPKRAPMPEQPDVVALTKDYKGREAVAGGEVFDASIDNIEKRTVRSTLSNGMKIALLAKETRGHAVEGLLRVHFASERELAGKIAAAEMIAPMLVRGTRRRSFQQMRDDLDRLKASVWAKKGSDEPPNSTVVHIKTVRQHLGEVLALVAEMVREPAFAPAEFEIVKKEELAALEQSSSDPMARGFNKLTRAMNPWSRGDIRYVPTIAERIARLRTLRVVEVKRLHALTWGGQSSELALVGDFDLAATQEVLAQQFAAWRAPRPFRRIVTPFKETDAVDVTDQTPDKKMSMVAAGHTVALRDDHPDFPALRMAGYILGGNPDSRLFNRLRQREGLSYGARSAVEADSLDELGYVYAYAICAPENADNAMAFLLEEIESLVGKGVSPSELEAAKTSYLEQFKKQLTSDASLAWALADGLYLGRTLAFEKSFNDKIAALTTADVHRAAAAYIDLSQLAKVKAGDFKH